MRSLQRGWARKDKEMLLINPRKCSLTALAFLVLVSTGFAQESRCELAKPKLAELRSKLVAAFQTKDYDRAYKIASEMVELGETNCIENDDIMLVLKMNVAQLQINRKKLDEAQKIYDENLERAERVYGGNSVDFQKYTEDLLRISQNAVGNEKFESYALKLLEAKEKRFGSVSEEFLSQLTRIARFYAAWKKPDISEKYFLQAMDVADKLPDESAVSKEKAVNRYRVFLITRYGEKEGLAKGESLMRTRYPDFPIREKVRNGLAYSLPKPIYSFAAKNVKASGEVSVAITVDESGHVVAANSTSGHPLLRKEAEAAAKVAKFLPTFLKGKAVQVTGIITYRFID